MSVRRLGLFFPTAIPLYTQTFECLKRAFHELGVDVAGGCSLLAGPALDAFVDQFKPDVIFELNRTRDMAPPLRRNVRHIAWMMDCAAATTQAFSGSDLVYYAAEEDLEHHRGACGRTGLLFCATDDDSFFPRNQAPVSDFSFVGHVPAPFTDADLDRLVHDGSRQVRFRELFALCLERWSKPHAYRPYRELALAYAAELAGEPVPMPPHPLGYDMVGRTARYVQRRALITTALRASASIRIYGPENWRKIPEAAPHYQSRIVAFGELAEVYRTTKLCLHSGSGLHWRTFDVMASGGALFFFDGPAVGLHRFFDGYFEEGVHYASFTVETCAEVAARYLRDDRARLSLGEKAARLVREKHTWRARARQVLADLAA